MKKILLYSIFIFLGVIIFLNPGIEGIATGVAILLFGMITLEEGFRVFASGPLENILKKSTNKLYKCLGLGFLSTSILQSSSLISVVLISFVSAGLLELRAAIGVVFGANLGTSTTAWLVSTLGLKIDIASLSMPILVFGVLLALQKSEKLKGLGRILVGLGFFFMGIYFMKNGFEGYKDSVNLVDFVESGILGTLTYILIGILITFVLQSSSATLALVLTVLAVGKIDYHNSIAVVIGANVGTTFTAILSSLGSNVYGKRLAGAHFTFKALTGLVALFTLPLLIMLVDVLSYWLGINPVNYTFKLALFHTVFNLLGVLLMVPLITPLIKVLTKLFKESEEENRIDYPKFLNKDVLNYPQTAVIALRNETKRLFENVVFKIITNGMNIHRGDILSDGKIKKVVKNSRDEIDINIEELYLHKVKTIYSKIIKYATLAQSQSSISPELTKQFSQIKLANRNMVESIKLLEEMRKNINEYIISDNIDIQKEYDKLRLKISRILRELYLLQKSDSPSKHLKALEKLKLNAEKRDVLVDGTLDQLIRERKITSLMASSLANDSYSVAQISKRIIEAGELIYINNDTLLTNGEIFDK